jgi:hypothetical protein
MVALSAATWSRSKGFSAAGRERHDRSQHCYNDEMQFTLRAMFIAIAVAAAACAAAKYFVEGDDPYAMFVAIFAIPILLCCTVGTLTGRRSRWFGIGVGIDIGLVGLVLLRLMMVA